MLISSKSGCNSVTKWGSKADSYRFQFPHTFFDSVEAAEARRRAFDSNDSLPQR